MKKKYFIYGLFLLSCITTVSCSSNKENNLTEEEVQKRIEAARQQERAKIKEEKKNDTLDAKTRAEIEAKAKAEAAERARQNEEDWARIEAEQKARAKEFARKNARNVKTSTRNTQIGSLKNKGSVNAACDQCKTTRNVSSYTLNGYEVYMCPRCKRNADRMIEQTNQSIRMMQQMMPNN